jgi:hypothetical protein
MALNTNTKEFTRLKWSILGFGILTLPAIIVMLFQFIYSLQVESILAYEFFSTLQFVCYFVVLFGFLLFTFGLHSFASLYTDKIGKEGKRIALYFLIFTIFVFFIFIFGFVFSLMMGDFQMQSTLMDIAAAYSSNSKYLDVGRFWGIGIMILFIFHLILAIRLSTWFNKAKLPFSERKALLMIVPGVLYFLAAFFTFISVAMLFPPADIYYLYPLDRITDLESIMLVIPLEDVVEAQLLSYFFFLIGFISQLLVNVNIFLNLNRMDSVE